MVLYNSLKTALFFDSLKYLKLTDIPSEIWLHKALLFQAPLIQIMDDFYFFFQVLGSLLKWKITDFSLNAICLMSKLVNSEALFRERIANNVVSFNVIIFVEKTSLEFS